jgi:hypothetical protein
MRRGPARAAMDLIAKMPLARQTSFAHGEMFSLCEMPARPGHLKNSLPKLL